MRKPEVLFICVGNGGKSQMAAAIATKLAGDSLIVHSAGTAPGSTLNAESVQAMKEISAHTFMDYPKAIDQSVLERADKVIVVGPDANVSMPPHARGQVERWLVVEPSLQGVEGMERMRLIRQDLTERTKALIADLTSSMGTTK